MHELMVACQELDADVVRAVNHSTPATDAGLVSAVADVGAVCSSAIVAVEDGAHDDAAVAVPTVVPDAAPAEFAEPCDIFKAIEWATGVTDRSLLLCLSNELPPAILRLQLAKYQTRDQTPAKPARLMVDCNSVNSKMRVAAALDKYLSSGVARRRANGRAAWGQVQHFVDTELLWPAHHSVAEKRNRRRRVLRWYAAWKKQGGAMVTNALPGKRGSCRHKPTYLRQRQLGNQGRQQAVQWVRQELYDWWAAMRYSIDWAAVHSQLRGAKRKRCIGRYTVNVIKTKAQQLLCDYVHARLCAGEKVKAPDISPRWIKEWASDYGLCLRKPNRKYKCPKYVLSERLEVMWLNTARVRALCEACHGYDPEFENWDQSPYHNNESGSVGAPTFAPKGSSEVPLIEGHNDTRKRWTGNFTTFSDTARISSGEYPYCEFVFKGGDQVQKRLQEYVRSCGWPRWVSVATSPKGSYREHNVLNFLERHLPYKTPSREWRIIMADDYKAHLTPSVRRLCWSRGYVFIPHGGGTTPVAQTVDTDLNQHARRMYVAMETGEYLRQMREGACIPAVKEEIAMDMMVRVMNNSHLHLAAAYGYKKTGITVKLDGTEDDQIVREAGVFWNERVMRPKINAAVADVRERVRQGRLSWTEAHVRSLIAPYRKVREVDEALERMGDDTWLEEDEEACASERCPSEAEDNASGDEADSAVADDGTDADNDDAPMNDASDSDETSDCMGGPVNGTTLPLADLTSNESDQLHNAKERLTSLRSALDILKPLGAARCVTALENDVRKEQRRLRALSTENPQVALSLARARDEAAQVFLEDKRRLDELKKRTITRKQLQVDINEQKLKLKKMKQDVHDMETLLETRHAIQNFTVETLGQGSANGGGPSGRKRRLAVLDRLRHLGTGLSSAQLGDFNFFKEEWDSKMLQTHTANWGSVFAGWIQGVIEKTMHGTPNAASLFVHAETVRVLHSSRTLSLPGAA